MGANHQIGYHYFLCISIWWSYNRKRFDLIVWIFRRFAITRVFQSLRKSRCTDHHWNVVFRPVHKGYICHGTNDFPCLSWSSCKCFCMWTRCWVDLNRLYRRKYAAVVDLVLYAIWVAKQVVITLSAEMMVSVCTSQAGLHYLSPHPDKLECPLTFFVSGMVDTVP